MRKLYIAELPCLVFTCDDDEAYGYATELLAGDIEEETLITEIKSSEDLPEGFGVDDVPLGDNDKELTAFEILSSQNKAPSTFAEALKEELIELGWDDDEEMLKDIEVALMRVSNSHSQEMSPQ